MRDYLIVAIEVAQQAGKIIKEKKLAQLPLNKLHIKVSQTTLQR